MPTHTDLNYNTIDFSKKKIARQNPVEIIRIIKKKGSLIDRDIQKTKKKRK
jgi:hypothetical protein